MQYRIRNGDRVIGNVGNRNLAVRTGQEYVMGYGIPNTVWKDGYAYAKLPTTVPVGIIEILPQGSNDFYYNLTPGQEYTQTIWFETDATVKNLSAAQITWFTTGGHDPQPASIQKLGQNSYKIVSTYTWPGKTDNNVRLFDIFYLQDAFDLSTGTYIKFGKLKLETGDTSTDWSPAPEDYGITDRTNAYRVTGLAPNTSYNLSVASFNGFRESPRASLTVKTRGIQVKVPVSLTTGATVSLVYLEYALGLVPIGTEPKGMFGGGNRQILPAKVVSSANGMSTIEITNSFNLMSDELTMKQLPDKSFGVFEGYKALYYKGGTN